MLRVEVTSEIIKRPPSEVFAYMADISTHPKWDETCVEAAYTSTGPLRVGSTYRRVDRFMGRRMEGTGQVTACEPGRKIAWSTPPPMPGEAAFTFEAAEGGTRVTARYDVQPKGFFWLLMRPLVPMMVRQAGRAGFRKLKGQLEAKS